jgi:hypothetical protein
MATTGPAFSPRDKRVTIFFDANGKFLRVEPDPFVISKSANHEVVWETNPPDVPFTVKFQPDSPFHYPDFTHDQPCSGLVRRDVNGDSTRRYEYTVEAGGTTIDPGGIVNP